MFYLGSDDISKIRDNLWLGAMPRDVGQFKYVFAFNEGPRYHIPIGTMVFCRPFNDAPTMPDIEMLHEMAQMVLQYSKKGPTLVHCTAGINRSSLVTALALIHDGIEPIDAINLLREKRGDFILENKTFRNWLLEQTNLPSE